MVQLSERVKFHRGGADPIMGLTDPISFTKTVESLPAITFHRNGAPVKRASSISPPYVPWERAILRIRGPCKLSGPRGACAATPIGLWLGRKAADNE